MTFYTVPLYLKKILVDSLFAVPSFIKNKPMMKGTLISIFFLISSWQQNVVAQSTNDDAFNEILPIIITSLLESQSANCMDVSEATTLNEPVLINSQNDVNALQGITRVDSLRIANVQTPLDFSPMASLVQVGGDLDIDRNFTDSVGDFSCLELIGGRLAIFLNEGLLSVPEFPSLSSIETFLSIQLNDSLTNIQGFPALEIVQGGTLGISSNNSLLSIGDFDSLISISNGGLAIFSNPALAEIPEFPALISTGSSINISGNDTIIFIPEFPSLVDVFTTSNAAVAGGTIVIDSNANLEQLNSFNSLSSDELLFIARNPRLPDIAGFNNTASSSLIVQDNDSLERMSGFNALRASRSIIISENDILNDLSVFDNIESVDSLAIRENAQLQEISNFNNLVEVGAVSIVRNSSLEEISGFNSLFELFNLNIAGNSILETISGFQGAADGSFLPPGRAGVQINSNIIFDCTDQILNLIPVAISEGNLVDCDDEGIIFQ